MQKACFSPLPLNIRKCKVTGRQKLRIANAVQSGRSKSLISYEPTLEVAQNTLSTDTAIQGGASLPRDNVFDALLDNV